MSLPTVRAIAAALIAALIFGAGWKVRGWRADAEIGAIHLANANATIKAQQEADEREKVLADAIAMIDAEHTAQRTKADEELTRLRAAVDAGPVRLLVRARCPAVGVPDPAVGPGVDPGARAELAADARPDYFALRAGLIRMHAKLAACQALVVKERQ